MSANEINLISALEHGPYNYMDRAMKRARNVAAVANTQRFDIKTPCKVSGKCSDCKSPDTICCQFLITGYSRHKDRIHVILVNDNPGF